MEPGAIATPLVTSTACRLPRWPGASSTATRRPRWRRCRLLPQLTDCGHAQIAAALRSAHIGGRLQIVPGPVEWLLDVAHNEPAAAVLAAELRARPLQGRTLAVVGVLGDKDMAGIAARLDDLVHHWIFCNITDEPRGLEAAAARARAGKLTGDAELMPTIAAGCERARMIAAAGDRVVVFGSHHAVGPALQWLGLY